MVTESCSHTTSGTETLGCLELAAVIGWTFHGVLLSLTGCSWLQPPCRMSCPEAGMDGPWPSCSVPCSYKVKHGARAKAGVVWCVRAFLMPFHLGKSIVFQRSLSQPQRWPFGAMGKRIPELLF